MRTRIRRFISRLAAAMHAELLGEIRGQHKQVLARAAESNRKLVSAVRAVEEQSARGARTQKRLQRMLRELSQRQNEMRLMLLQANGARRSRVRIALQGIHRLCVHRTPQHIYAQIIAPEGNRVVASASTLTKDLRASLKSTGNIAAAAAVGKQIAERAKQAGIEAVAFDRSGFKYHGRVKALADAAREAGLKF